MENIVEMEFEIKVDSYETKKGRRIFPEDRDGVTAVKNVIPRKGESHANLTLRENAKGETFNCKSTTAEYKYKH